jgi:hypothetical protein
VEVAALEYATVPAVIQAMNAEIKSIQDQAKEARDAVVMRLLQIKLEVPSLRTSPLAPPLQHSTLPVRSLVFASRLFAHQMRDADDEALDAIAVERAELREKQSNDFKVMRAEEDELVKQTRDRSIALRRAVTKRRCDDAQRDDGVTSSHRTHSHHPYAPLRLPL